MIFFSATELGFYDNAIHESMPEDCVEISADYRVELLLGQSAGKVITYGDDGYPVLIDPPPLTPEEAAKIERAWRDALLAATDGVVSRHRDEFEEGGETTLAAEQYAALQAFRRALRNWPESGEFPLAEHRPPAPDWLVDQLT
ncbi:phage tail assembly chaperone [Pseudomonas putida]|uniref:phage tail assembly chaperone n=1 Tax=Pseudomonas putida TaxID=303 RepID=UPI003D982925